MFCHQCGARVPNRTILCERCAKENPQDNTPKDKPVCAYYDLGYAGFWLRFFALLVDGSLIVVTSYLLYPLMRPIFHLLDPLLARWLPLAAEGSILEGRLLTGGELAILSFIVGWFYSANMESSRYQATLGKMLLGIMVTDDDRYRLSFLQASMRYLAKLASCGSGLVGFAIAGCTAKKQALHDIFTASLVIKRQRLSFGRLARGVAVSCFSALAVLAMPNFHYLHHMRQRVVEVKQSLKGERKTGHSVFRYTDQDGKIHFVDREDKIPEKYRTVGVR